jgi:4-hydroxy-tetrahydrodipicolinate reductase
MNIALIGYGKMGKEIEAIALSRGHIVPLVIDVNNRDDLNPDKLKDIDVAIEFTIPDSAYDNYMRCFESNVPVVSGTTGWLDKYNDIKVLCENEGKSFFYAPNFSLGVNIFFKLNQYLAQIMDNQKEYSLKIEETHHKQKKDAPSGTAIKLAEDILNRITRKHNWSLDNNDEETLNIKAFREEGVFGIHKVRYESDFDELEIMHNAKSRKGFASGAVIAAEYLKGKTGMYTMDDMLNF